MLRKDSRIARHENVALLRQKLKVGCHRHNVFVFLPLPANLEVAENFAGHVGFERPLDAGTKAIFGAAKFGRSRRYIEQRKDFKVAKEPLIGREMRNKLQRLPVPESTKPNVTTGEARRWGLRERGGNLSTK